MGRWWDGTKPLVYMPLGYCDEVDRPLPSDDARWSCAVRFLVGWEPRHERLLVPVKSLDVLVGALCMLKDFEGGLECLFVGDGEGSFVQERRQTSVTGKRRFFNSVARLCG